MPPLPSGLFFQTMFDFFFICSSFLLFHKNYYHSTKGREPAQSPKPAVSLPLNPSFHGHRSKSKGRGFLSLNLTFLGHGSGLCPKNLLSSKVSSVNYEQFRVGFFLHLKIVFISSLITPARFYQSRHNITSKS